MTSIGFSEEQGAQAVVAMGFSALAGKITLSAVGDIVPFPKFFLFMVATVMGIALSFSLFFISTMVHVFLIISGKETGAAASSLWCYFEVRCSVD